MRSHYFEVMDQVWVPASLRDALRDILQTCNSTPFRKYYLWVVNQIVSAVADRNASQIVELGAGTAPLARHLLHTKMAVPILIRISDLNPDIDVFTELAKQSNGRIKPFFEPLDFGLPRQWPKGTLLVLSATFHHLPHLERVRLLRFLVNSNVDFLIAEPVVYNFLSFFMCLLGWVPAIAAPLMLFKQPGLLRRVLWCWVIPIAPIAFVIDGLVSTWRAWSDTEWHLVVASLAPAGDSRYVFRRGHASVSVMRISAAAA